MNLHSQTSTVALGIDKWFPTALTLLDNPCWDSNQTTNHVSKRGPMSILQNVDRVITGINCFNSWPSQTGRHFAEDIFKCISLDENFQVNFPGWKTFEFWKSFTEICSLRSNWQYGSIGDNGTKPLSETLSVYWYAFTQPQWANHHCQMIDCPCQHNWLLKQRL